MDLKLLAAVFGAVFIAELGDKTQLATFLFAADRPAAKLTVFLGASLALVLASAIGVLGGAVLAKLVDPQMLRYIAGAGFVAIGLWMIVTA